MDDNAAVSSFGTNTDEPEKFIRTFAGDMDTLQKGGTPDLVPLVEEASPVKGSSPIPLPPPQARIPVPTPIATPTPSPVPLPVRMPPTPAPKIVPPNIPPLPSRVVTPFPILTPKPPQSPSASQVKVGEPEKFIRTFAGDMEVLQGGGIPNLAPLPAASPDAKARLVAPSPIITTPVISIFHSLPQARPPAPVARPAVTPIKTYESDFSERMKETHASAATVLAAEQDRAQPAPEVLVEKSSNTGRAYVIAGIILLIAGVGGAYYEYTRYTTVIAPIVLAPTVSAPIFVDEREEISGTGPALLLAMEQSVTRPLAPNAVRLLYIASTTTKSVFSSLPISAPDVLVRNVNVQGSMAGVVNVGGSQSPFFILSVSSYSNTFAGMLSWEVAMPRVLSALFPTTKPSNVLSTTATTTVIKQTPAAPSILPPFRDEVVSNHDVRVYHDPTGQTVLLYGYWNQTTLVIARNADAFAEILQRLATSRAQ